MASSFEKSYPNITRWLTWQGWIVSVEIAELDAHLDRLVAQAAPELVASPGIGTDSAATLLIVVGDNPRRLGSEASFAILCAGSLPSKPPPARS